MNRPPLMFVSGWGHSADTLRPLATLCGSAACFSLAELAGPAGAPDAGELISRTTRAPAPPVLIGWSAGGILALEAACRGTRLSGLVLLSGTPRFCSAADWSFGIPLARVRALRAALQSPRGPAAKLAFQRQCARPDPVGESELADRVSTMDREGADRLDAGLDYLMAADVREASVRIRIPTLLLHGREDQVIPSGASEWLAARIPSSRLVLFQGRGHRLPLDHPEQPAGDIERFLETLGHAAI